MTMQTRLQWPKKLFLQFKIIMIMLSCSVDADSYAQRGKPSPRNELKTKTASDGFSGFFDANMTPKGHLNFDFPTFAVDYGLSPDLTIGSNALNALSLSGPAKFLSGKIRYRLFSTEEDSAALTVYAGHLAGLSSTEQAANFFIASVNTTSTFSGGLWGSSLVTGSMLLKDGSDGTLQKTSTKRYLTLFSLWVRPKLTESIESDLLITTCPLNRLVSTNGAARVDLDDTCVGDKKTDPVLRALVSWRSSENWLWSLGVLWFKTIELKYGFPVFGVNYSTSTSLSDPEEQ